MMHLLYMVQIQHTLQVLKCALKFFFLIKHVKIK